MKNGSAVSPRELEQVGFAGSRCSREIFVLDQGLQRLCCCKLSGEFYRCHGTAAVGLLGQILGFDSRRCKGVATRQRNEAPAFGTQLTDREGESRKVMRLGAGEIR